MKRQRQNKKLVLGLTGSFGSGKSTVADMFRRLGGQLIAFIDADEIAHEIIRPGTYTYDLIISVWGRDILKKDRTIDRKKFGQLIFGDYDVRKQLERITHPLIIKRIKQDIKRSSKEIIILDAPLLIEAGLERIVDKLIVVNASKSHRIKRKLTSTYLKRAEIIKRIDAQMPLADKIKRADFIIDNNKTFAETRTQVKKLWLKIKGEKNGKIRD
ncbi:MAG: dephospho-CoA kinase [Candidatus Omnitrophica bacterium]|nr:dephospho-CoA kinase [Candidatus Omnitrophota bacterium]